MPAEQTADDIAPESRLQTRILCVLLYLIGRIPYNSIPRVLDVFHENTPLPRSWIPHPTSINHWVLRVGLALLKQVEPIDEPWIAIADHSIGMGTKKVLVVLRVRLDTLEKKGQAIALTDCECIGLKVVETVNGQTIAADFDAIFAQSGQPECLVKDRDRTLNKGAVIWSEPLNENVYFVDDISHMVASCLKAEFEKDERYKKLLTETHQLSKALHQSTLACAAPPKMQTKARFQGLVPLAKWTKEILDKLKVRGRPVVDSFLGKLRPKCAGIKELEPFLERFIQSVNVTAKLMALLKNEGLTLVNYFKSIAILAELPDDSKVKEGMLAWLERHILIYREMGKFPLMVSSDIIESLFGIFKYLHGRGPQKDVNSGILLIPTLCGELEVPDIIRSLNQVGQTMLDAWIKENIPETILQERRIHFK